LIGKGNFVILGAGPAGLGAAYLLRKHGRGEVAVVERGPQVGGLAGSFMLADLPVDFGSHRLHPSCEPRVMNDIRALLGDDLLDRPRHGRIRLRGKWIHFPLKPLDLALHLPWSFAWGAALDSAAKTLGRRIGKVNGHESFASVLLQGLGPTICRDFYFPYARKIWGALPEELSAIQARRRVKAGSIGKLVAKVASAVPGLKPRGSGRFFYPRRGYGQICQAYAQAARDLGAEFHLESTVEEISVQPNGGLDLTVSGRSETRQLSASQVWSTIPLTQLAKAIRPSAPPEVLDATERIQFRSMVLVYVVLGQRQFTEFDAHYFPGSDIPFTRMSEPRNYCNVREPANRTVLCAELPCQEGDRYWNMSEQELADLLCHSLRELDLPVQSRVETVQVRRLRHAYPVYYHGYEESFSQIDDWLATVPNLLSLGRQGLFAHDNTHHTLAMAYAAVDCLNPTGDFDRSRWAKCRETFQQHVVED
jgi:protoporphyrinogen oxidase